MAQENPTPRDETLAPLLFIAALLVLDIIFSSTRALPGHNHLEPLDSALKALLMLSLALLAYVRPVAYGAQLLERGYILGGLTWLIVILGAPFAVLAVVDKPGPQLGLLLMVICAITAHICAKALAPPFNR